MTIKSFLLVCSFFVTIQTYAQWIDPAELPEVEDYAFVQSHPDADTIIIGLHGGPTDFLAAGNFNYMENIPTFSVVELLKYEMMNEVLSNASLTVAEGYAVNDTTAAMIEKAVQYYKDLDKVVVLIGHSWGSLVLGEYLDDYGAVSPHRIICMEGRLSVQQEFVDYLIDGYLPTFASDGVTIELSTAQYAFDQAILNLAAGSFGNRWVDSLANEDMRKLMYTYAENDMNTGALIEVETDFLEASGAHTLFVPGQAHGGSFDVEYQDEIVRFIREDLVSDNDELLVNVEPLKLYPSVSNTIVNIESITQGSLEIYNLMGRRVYNAPIDNLVSSVDVSALANGQYVALLRSEEGGISQGRFMVQR